MTSRSSAVAAMMLATLGALVTQLATGDTPTWVAASSLGLASAAILVAAVRTVPNAVRLGHRTDSDATSSRLARSILHDHVFCFCAIVVCLAVQLAFGR